MRHASRLPRIFSSPSIRPHWSASPSLRCPGGSAAITCALYSVQSRCSCRRDLKPRCVPVSISRVRWMRRLRCLTPVIRSESLPPVPGMDESDFVKLLGRDGDRALRRLVSQGVVRRVVELPVPRLKPRYACRLVPLPSPRGPACAEPCLTPLPDRQAQLLTTVGSATEPYPLTLANKEFGAGVANALLQKGLIGQDWTRLDQSPIPEGRDTGPCPALTLTGDQSEALSQINRALDDPLQQPRSFLLHGVTGSGKTEVYLQAAHRAVANGRQAIYLVPEISLTPQTLERVSNRFPGRVAVVHSRLTSVSSLTNGGKSGRASTTWWSGRGVRFSLPCLGWG